MVSPNIKARPSELLAAHRDEVLALLRHYGASNVRVFGSVARGEDDLDSDVDLLADLPRGTTLVKRIEIEQNLAELFECDVDLVKPNEVPAGMKDKVFAEARPL